MTVTISKPAINIREKLAEVDKPSGTAGHALLRAETVAEQQHLLGVGRRNIVINGNFSQWQRGTTFTGVATSNTYLADRWSYSEGTVSPVFTVTQEQGPIDKGFANAIKFNVTTADNSLSANAYAQLVQKIEGYNLQSLAKGTDHAKPITVSFYVKSNKPGRYGLTLWDGQSSRQNSGSYEIQTPDTWEYKTVTFTGDTTGTIDNDNTEGLQLSFTLAMGTSYTGGDEGVSSHTSNTDDYAPFHEVNLIESTGNTWELAGVQMEVGTVATPFEHRSYGEELALCQRYYLRLGADGNTTNLMLGGVEGAAYGAMGGLVFPTTMRAVPTISQSNTYFYSAAGGGLSYSIGTNRCSREVGSFIAAGMSGLTAGQAASIYKINSSAYLEFTAEL